ncbi:MAG: hypothetical protein F6K24_08145 [Okeania sp. SIO2D1]|nr:hypothetical protein [Okeania sp. SIO2D1]
MARIWKELRVQDRRWKPSSRPIPSFLVDCPMLDDAAPPEFSPDPAIIPEFIYYVHVCGFTFRFWSISQIQLCLDFYSQKLNPSSRISISPNWQEKPDHSLLQTWYSRLPLALRKENKRQQVIKALKKALEKFSDEPCLLPWNRGKVRISRPRVRWCFKCDKVLGQGRCLKCKRRRFSPEGYRVAHCNNCDTVWGEGECESCQKFRKKLKEIDIQE